MRRNKQRGQAIILVLISLSLFVLAAIGLAIDASQLYAHRQMAQAAADAAAQAAIMSAFNGTNTGANAFGSEPFTCTTGTDVRTPCVFARYNGFGDNPADTVAVDFPETAAGVTLSDEDDPNLIRVTVLRDVDTTLMRFVGPSKQKIAAQATAAIADVVSPVPIIVLHPTNSGSFRINGNPTVRICGGPTKSIQVNSSSATSITIAGGGGSNLVDLSKAGPKNWFGPNSCDGAGADFGDFGGPSVYPGGYNWGVDGRYIQPASPIKDPLIDVPEPSVPSPPGSPNPENVTGGTGGCPLPSTGVCKLYKPGVYPTGISIKNEFALFQPGLYYLSGGGFHIEANGEAHMAPCTDPAEPTYGCGMVVYNAGTNAAKDIFEITANAGKQPGMPNGYPYTFPDGTACTGNCLLGSQDTGIYKGILFFQKRATGARQHSLQGGGGLVLRGTIYLTNTEPTMRTTPANFQWLPLQGTPGSTTRIIGMIIVDQLELGGNAEIRMTLDPAAKLYLRQIALVR
jgi:hypothetical protein